MYLNEIYPDEAILGVVIFAVLKGAWPVDNYAEIQGHSYRVLIEQLEEVTDESFLATWACYSLAADWFEDVRKMLNELAAMPGRILPGTNEEGLREYLRARINKINAQQTANRDRA